MFSQYQNHSLTDEDESSSSSDSEFSFHEIEKSLWSIRVPTSFVCPVKSKGEIGIDDLPPIEELNISVNENELVEVGIVHAIVGKQVVVRTTGDQKALDVDSVLFLTQDKPLGRIFEVFGPVAKPFYTVIFNSSEDIITKRVSLDHAVYFAPEKIDITSYVFVDNLLYQKGSDASWADNNEPPEECLDYSDDEQEKLAKWKKKSKNRCQEDDELQIVSEISSENKIRKANFNNEPLSDNIPVWTSPPSFLASRPLSPQPRLCSTAVPHSIYPQQLVSPVVQNVNNSTSFNAFYSMPQLQQSSIIMPQITLHHSPSIYSQTVNHPQHVNIPSSVNSHYIPSPHSPAIQNMSHFSVLPQNGMQPHMFGQITPTAAVSPAVAITPQMLSPNPIRYTSSNQICPRFVSPQSPVSDASHSLWQGKEQVTSPFFNRQSPSPNNLVRARSSYNAAPSFVRQNFLRHYPSAGPAPPLNRFTYRNF